MFNQLDFIKAVDQFNIVVLLYSFAFAILIIYINMFVCVCEA